MRVYAFVCGDNNLRTPAGGWGLEGVGTQFFHNPVTPLEEGGLGLGEQHWPVLACSSFRLQWWPLGGRVEMIHGWERRCLPSSTPPAPQLSSLFTFPVLLAEPPVDALYHPGQLLLLQLPLLLPRRWNARGSRPVSANTVSAAGPELHFPAAAAAAAATPPALADTRLRKEVRK